jgi:hypothetical protein
MSIGTANNEKKCIYLYAIYHVSYKIEAGRTHLEVVIIVS